MKRLVWMLFAGGLAAGAYFTLRPQAVLVDLGNPETRTVREFIAEEAKTRLNDQYLVDMPVSGTLKRIELEVGDEVQKGQVVAEVDAFELSQQLAALDSRITQARAQIAGVDIAKPKPEDIDTASMRAKEAADAVSIAQKEREITEINLNEARKNYARLQKLADDGVVSESQRDEAERAFRALEEGLVRARLSEEAASKNVRVAQLNAQRVEGSIDDNEYMRQVYQAEVESLEAQRKVVENDLEKTQLRSPVTGPVLEKFVEDRRVLVAGTPLLAIGDLSSIEIESDVLSEEVGRIPENAPVEILGKALQGQTAAGQVKRVYPAGFKKISSLGIEQQRVKVIISFDNAPLRLRVGTRVDVRIITNERQNTLSVPERSTFRREGEWYVFTVENGLASLAPVTIGLKNDDWAEITGGLSLESTIILEPKNELEDGARVAAKAE